MDRGVVDVEAVFDRIAGADQFHYRLALVQDGTCWRAHTLLLDDRIPEDSASTSSFTYAYRDIQFHAGVIDAPTARGWVVERTGTLPSADPGAGELAFSLAPLAGKVNWQRYRSCIEADWAVRPWPLTRFDVSGNWSPMNDPTANGFLLNETAPFFPDFRVALFQLIYQTSIPLSGSSQTPSPVVIVRYAETGAYLRHVRITPTLIQIVAAGDHLPGTRLTVSDNEGLYVERELTDAEPEEEVALPDEVPVMLYVVLSRGGDWLDYYHRDARWPVTRGSQGNVTIEEPIAPPEVAFDAIIAGGEGQHTEFKRELNADDKKRLLSTVSAFANATGGLIIVGVDKSGAVMGLQGNVPDLMDTIMRTVHDNIVPMPEVEIGTIQLDSKTLIAVQVAPTSQHPCGVNHADPRYYIRRGATNFPAQPEEISELVLARQPAPPPTSPFLGYQ